MDLQVINVTARGMRLTLDGTAEPVHSLALFSFSSGVEVGNELSSLVFTKI